MVVLFFDYAGILKLLEERTTMHDELTSRINEDILEDNGLIVNWILMSSYQYYIKNANIMPDSLYDALWRMLKEQWCNIEHEYKHLIEEDSLTTNSLYYLKPSEYPEEIVEGSERWT